MLNRVNLNYVFPNKAKSIAKVTENFIKKDSEIVKIFKSATILPVYDFHDMHGNGGVINSEGNYVEMSSQKNRVSGSYEYNKSDCKFENKKVVYCGFFYRCWGHFITEVVSKLWYALKRDNSIDQYIFITEKGSNAKFNGNYLEFLRLLGIEDKVVIINQPTVYAEVVIPEDGFVYDEYFTNSYLDMYQYIIKKGLKEFKGKTYEKLYFSKNKIISSIESNLNLKFIDKYFETNGFKVIYPEQLTLVETIGLMQNAKYFCGISSSLAHNQIFGHANQTMISIEKQAFYTPYQIFVTNITGCNVVYIDAFRHIFPVNSGGPFLYDYTDYLDEFAKDFGLSRSKPMSRHKYRRMFRKYMIFYFDLNNVLPPDWMYRQYIIDMSRDAYNDTIRNGKIFHMSLYNRAKMKLRKIFFNLFGTY